MKKREIINSVGWIYFIGNRQYRFCKIGFSKNVKKRLNTINTSCPVDLEVFVKIPGDKEMESYLHKAFDTQRYKGEWFLLNKEIEDFIECQKNGIKKNASQKLLNIFYNPKSKEVFWDFNTSFNKYKEIYIGSFSQNYPKEIPKDVIGVLKEKKFHPDNG